MSDDSNQTRIFLLADGESWSAGECFVTEVNDEELDLLCEGDSPLSVVEKDRWESVDDILDGETKTVTVTINPRLLRHQRDAVLNCLQESEHSEILLPKTREITLDGLLNMLDMMLDQAEGYPE